MESRRSLGIRLLAGLAVILTGAIVYSGYTASQIRALRDMQSRMVDRNRMDALLLLRIQSDLNALGLGMRDMLESAEPYPVSAWEMQFRRVRADLADALQREARTAPVARTDEQSRYLLFAMTQFWDAMDRTFLLAKNDDKEARTQVRLSLQARVEALNTTVSRFITANYESQEQAAAEAQQIYSRVERNLYIFFAALLVVVGLTGAYLLRYNRRVFDQVTELSKRRSELAQQLISTQENTYRSISRELHDDFGQVLTAIGLVLRRAGRDLKDEALRTELLEAQTAAQSALDRVRTLSQALHPVMLEEVGLESAIANYIPLFSKRAGIETGYTKTGESRRIDGEVAIHTYRILQEALNNVARHARSTSAAVRLQMLPGSLTLEVEDQGIGFSEQTRDGLGDGIGLISMCERAEILKGTIQFLTGTNGGACVRLCVPLAKAAAEEEELHAAG